MRKIINLFVLCMFVLILLPNYSFANIDEKKVLINSYFGKYENAKKDKKKGKVTLSIWESHLNYVKKLPFNIQKGFIYGVERLEVVYDEIWTWEKTDGFSTKEKKKYKGMFDIYKLYWLKDKIQACTIEKYYEGDPSTKEKLLKPTHKIWGLYDRDYILKNYNK